MTMHDIKDLELCLSSNQEYLTSFDDLRFFISNFDKRTLRAT